MLASASERRHFVLGALSCVLLVRPAFATGPGDGNRARPALLSAPVAAPGDAGHLAAAVDLGLGVTEPLTEADSSHQRLGFGAAASVDASKWLSLGLSLSGRYDRHGRDEQGRDDGFLFLPELSARAAWLLGGLGVGAEVAGWLPGGPDVGTSFSAISADSRLFVSSQGNRLTWAGFAGYRLDRSAEASKDAERLRFGDRVALGASEHDAALVGVGLGYAAGRSFLFGEASSRLLLGVSSLSDSPSFLSLGVRHPLTDSGLSFELSLSGLLSSRPSTDVGAELLPIEPRAFLNIGLRFRRVKKPHGAVPPPVVAPPVQPPPPVAPPSSSVELALLDEQGQPLLRAKVTLLQGQRETPLDERSPGRYGSDKVEPGPARVRVQADGFQPIERDITISSGQAVQVEVRVQQALPAGQVRGLVRSLRGKAVDAKVRIEPAGVETKTDADGFFQIDVPPGQYDVVIEAAGYQAQRRAVKVEQQGVVMVNADLGQVP